MAAVFLVPVASDPGSRDDDASCAVSVLCSAESRMEAVELLRACGVSVSSRKLTLLKSAPWVPEDPPDVLPGEVWVRPAYVAGGWRRLGRS